MSEQRFFALLSWGWSFFILLVCLLPSSSLRGVELDFVWEWDKLVHALLFYVFTILWSIQTSIQRYYLILLIAIGLGILIEYLQRSPFINRDFDWNDALADTIGAILAVVTLYAKPNLKSAFKKYLPFVN